MDDGDSGGIEPQDALARTGYQLQEEGRYSEAAAKYQEALRFAPLEPLLWFDLAVSYRYSDQLKAGYRAIRRAIELDEGDPSSWRCYANICKDLSWCKKAEEAYWTALRLDPDSTDTLNNLALLYLQSDRPERALQLLLRATVLDPNDQHVHLNLGIAYEQLTQLDKAIEEYRSSANIAPTFILALKCLLRTLPEVSVAERIAVKEQIEHLEKLGYD